MNRAIQHVREIFTSSEGTYMNEYGEEVYGKLPRVKLENPLDVLKRPTGLSESSLHAGGYPLSPTLKMARLIPSSVADYLYFVVGWAAWTMDGYDFQSVSLSLSSLAIYFGQARETVATSITLTLLFRPIGAIIFGIAGDLYGRKWPLVINLMVLCFIVIGTVQTTTFTQFLIVCS